LNMWYFSEFQQLFFHSTFTPKEWYGLQATSSSGWVDPGQFLLPPIVQRGFPHDVRSAPVLYAITKARVGVAQGLVLGDPDIGAVHRIATAPVCHGVHEVARAGFVVDPKEAWTIFNSQNTAVIRELAPAFFMIPFVGRYDDIFASLILQRIMREHGYVTHFGQPFVWQERNQHNLVRDLKNEQFGMEHIGHLADLLNSSIIAGAMERHTSVVEQVRAIFTLLIGHVSMLEQSREAALAWCNDVETVL